MPQTSFHYWLWGAPEGGVHSEASLGHSGFGIQVKYTGREMQVKAAENEESRYWNSLRDFEWGTNSNSFPLQNHTE